MRFNGKIIRFEDMSFRWKAILFIATIEGLFNVLFAFVVVVVMQSNLEEQFLKRARISADLFASFTTSSVLSTDIATLESFVDDVVENEDILYAKVYSGDMILASRAVDLDYLNRPFEMDTSLKTVGDNVFDTFAPIVVGGTTFGRVEIGLSTLMLGSTIGAIQLKVILIGAGEIIFSALISFFLGSFLVKRLVSLRDGSDRLARGEYGYQLDQSGGDEIGRTMVAFNNMSRKTGELVASMRHTESELEQKSGSLAVALEKQKTANALQTQFVFMVSHEFRTPLTIIDGAAQMLDRRFEQLSPPQVKAAAGKVRKAVKRLTHLMEGILITGKMEAGKVRLSCVDVDIASLIEEVCTDQKSVCTSHNVEFDKGSLPDNIVADPTLIYQILINLISNAIKYSPEATRITVRAVRASGGVAISVQDFGIGIPQQDQKKLFERYFRASNTSGIAGTGIGLSLARHLARLHGGDITLESTEKKGTIFTLWLPRTQNKPPVATAAE